MSTTQKKKLLAQLVLFAAGVAGFLLMIYSIGTANGDHIDISIQLTLNVRACVTGFAIMCMASYLYKSFIKDEEV